MTEKIREGIIQYVRDEAEAHKEEGVTPQGVAADLISTIAATFMLPVKVWVPFDMEEEVRGQFEGLEESDPARFQKIIEGAASTKSWRDLADCTEQDWDRIHNAVEEAEAQLREEES